MNRRAVTSAGQWAAPTTIEMLVRGLAADGGIPIDWDPAIAYIAGDDVPALSWDTETPVWNAVNALARSKMMSVKVCNERLVLTQRVRPDDSSNIPNYESDPLSTFTAAQYLIEHDRRFHSRWSSIADCEQTAVELPPGTEFKTIWDVVQAIAKASRSPSIVTNGPSSAPVESDGLRTGTALDVLRSWCPQATVYVGRAGLEAWISRDEAALRAEDKRDYEQVRAALAASPWTRGTGDYAIDDVVTSLPDDLYSVTLLDPEVTSVTVSVTDGMSFLSIFDEASSDRCNQFGWTWSRGFLVLTHGSAP